MLHRYDLQVHFCRNFWLDAVSMKQLWNFCQKSTAVGIQFENAAICCREILLDMLRQGQLFDARCKLEKWILTSKLLHEVEWACGFGAILRDSIETRSGNTVLVYLKWLNCKQFGLEGNRPKCWPIQVLPTRCICAEQSGKLFFCEWQNGMENSLKQVFNYRFSVLHRTNPCPWQVRRVRGRGEQRNWTANKTEWIEEDIVVPGFDR